MSKQIFTFSQAEVAALIDLLETFLLMLGSLPRVPPGLLAVRLKVEGFLNKLRSTGQLVNKRRMRAPKAESGAPPAGTPAPRISELVLLAEGLSDVSGVDLEKALLATSLAMMIAATGESNHAAG